MKKPVFRGACTALVTPFRNGGIDYETLDRLLDTQLAAGIEALVICGTTGEAATLDQPETLAIIAHCVRYCGGKTRLIAGTGGNNTAKAVETARAAAALGVDALLSVTPYYNRCTQEGLLAHYGAIAAATSLPVLLYNVPSRTCVDISPETVARLAELPTVAGIKEANPDVGRLLRLRALCGPDFPIYCGSDDRILPFMVCGAIGAVSVLSNLRPEAVKALVDAALRGEYARALQLQMDQQDLIEALFSEVSPIPIKAALGLSGLDVGTCRLPLTPPGESLLSRLKLALGQDDRETA
ncbi:MAG: 4-hydroxy-tetrahydrodipicolinate synthase [Oscillospiraceae bacterium]|nr:4-hydroxy-tetrahydrodipicolinate synthase [Oscillospiraceae bacterium]